MYKKPVAVTDLQLGMYVIELDRPWLGTPFDFQGFPIVSQEQIDLLTAHCKLVYVDPEREVWVPGKRARPAAPLALSLEPIPVEKELLVAPRVYEECEVAIRQSLDNLRVQAKLEAEKLTAAVASMTESMQRNPDAILLLNRLHEKSSYELGRALDSSVLMIAFGRFLQFAKDRLEVLGLAGMLLDVGKVRVPDEVLNKSGMLTPDEYQVMKEHVTHSLELVRGSNGRLPPGIDEIIMQHHERQDGSGYPRGLKGSEISIEGSIAAIVDSFSALTSARAFAEPRSPSSALNLLHTMRGKCFHEALVEQFIQCVGIYPVGSAIELNTGEIGIVITQNLVRRLQPRVMVILDQNLKQLPQPHLILDLIKEPKTGMGEPYRIRRTLPLVKLPLNVNELLLPWLRPNGGSQRLVGMEKFESDDGQMRL
ncbi:MAG: HD-GYP domain-containing protein [Burkholderiales bacterium]